MAKSLEEVREEFRKSGVVISEWARDHGFEPQVVVDVLNGRRKGKFGVGRKVLIVLGLHDSEVPTEQTKGGNHGGNQ